ncbi:HNH endonuclease signature motif containing protein [Micromonosporaceae bacterium Da 78-11]
MPATHWLSLLDASDPDACWQWPGPLDTHGYGQLDGGGAHRVLYQQWFGVIPPGLQVDHLCHNGTGCNNDRFCPHRSCVNPTHLEAVTARVNQTRSLNTLGGANSRKTHCRNGHEFSESNIYRPPSRPKSRVCRECLKANQQARFKARARVAA